VVTGQFLRQNYLNQVRGCVLSPSSAGAPRVAGESTGALWLAGGGFGEPSPFGAFREAGSAPTIAT